MCMRTPNQALSYLVHEISGVLHECEVYLPKLIFLAVGKLSRQNVSRSAHMKLRCSKIYN